MSVIAEVLIPSDEVELGEPSGAAEEGAVELESIVPAGGAAVPLFGVDDSARDSFLERVRRHPGAEGLCEMEVSADRTLYAIDWDLGRDRLFGRIIDHGGRVLSATGTDGRWEFELRFRSHGDLRAFRTSCEEAGVALEVVRLSGPTDQAARTGEGPTEAQREALQLAVRRGYYDIPRDCATADLAEALGISDQAVTERLRRGIAALVSRHLLDGAAES